MLGIIEVMIDYMSRGQEQIYVNKIPDSQWKLENIVKMQMFQILSYPMLVLSLSPMSITDYVR